MAVAFRAAGAINNSAVGTPTVAYPAGVASGDLLVIQFVCVSSNTPTTPSGWTKRLGPVALSGGGNLNAYVYYKVAGGSEPSSVTFATAGSASAGGIMSAFTGVDGAAPIDVSNSATLPTSGSSGTTPSVTTTKANTMLLRMYWGWVSAGTTIAPPGTDTERYEAFDTNDSVEIELATSIQAGTGASGTTTATFSAGYFGGLGATIAIAPLSAATPVADFSGTPLSGTASLSVTFTDSSSNTPTGWAWDFGDGGTSSSQNPSHSYTSAGTYTVALIATNAAGSDTKTRSGYVVVSETIAYATGGGIDIY